MLVWDMGVERSAHGHVDHLETSAYPQKWQALCSGSLDHLDFNPVAVRVNAFYFGTAFHPKDVRIEISPA